MANITAQMVKELRELTGAGMMDCKKALSEADGDMEKAGELLREKGLAAAAKKAGRVAAEGTVQAFVDGNKAVLLEVNIETDFAAKGDEFKDFVKEIADQILKTDVADVDALLASESVAEPGKTVSDLLTAKIAKIGENMSIRRFVKYDINGFVDTYIHDGGRVGVLVELSGAENKEVAHDVALHIAAANPKFVVKDEVPTDELEKEKEILKQQALNEGKPENIVEKMVLGRIKKFYQEICLTEQAFVKDGDITVGKLVADAGLKVERFARFELGEGIEKKEENFADEVAKQVAGK